nr:MAG: putative maturation protein [Leviviridae sp.]
MAMRTRSRYTLASGTITTTGPDGEDWGTQTITRETSNEWCRDVSDNPGGNNPFQIDHIGSSVSVSGYTTWNGGKRYQTFSSVIPDWIEAPYQPVLDNISSATLAARTNPTKPVVDLPLFLFELKDLPGMAESALNFGKSLPQAGRLIQNALSQLSKGRRPPGPSSSDLAGINLQLNMGWAPFVGDLEKMLGLGEAAARRLKQLQRMAKSHITKRVEVDSRSESASWDAVFDFGGAYFKGRANQMRTAERWASARWQYFDHAIPKSPITEADVSKIILGLSGPSLSTLWNALPWTFLIDYFTDLGDVFEATRSGMQMYSSHKCVCTETKSTNTISMNGMFGTRGTGGGQLTRLTKTRLPLTDFPSPSFDGFLSAKQVSILGSLAVARRSTWQ